MIKSFTADAYFMVKSNFLSFLGTVICLLQHKIIFIGSGSQGMDYSPFVRVNLLPIKGYICYPYALPIFHIRICVR